MYILSTFGRWLRAHPHSQNRRVSRAGATGLEPATSAVTGQRSNLLSYAPAMLGAPGRRSVPLQYAKAGPSAPPRQDWPAGQLSTRLPAHGARRSHPSAEFEPADGDARGPARRARRDRSVPAGRNQLLARAHAALRSTTRCRCCSRRTSASGRSSRCACSTATWCSCSGRPPTTTSRSRTRPTSRGANRTSAT